jgi:hypothetical protein
MEGTAPPARFVPPVQTVYPPVGSSSAPQPAINSGPNPALAGILAGFFPIGVGAVYAGQYAKGLTHLVVMVLLILGVSADLPWEMTTVLGISIGFFYVYQIIDAIRSAKAIQMGEPAPDPFGLAQVFGTGEKFEGTKVPTGAAILIGLGVLFLLHTAGLFEIGMGLFVSLILIFLGVWLFAKHWGLIGVNRSWCQCDRCRTRRLMGPAMLVTLGVLLMLHSVSRVGFDRTWPAILLVIGVVKLVQSNASPEGHIGPLPPGMPPSVPPGSQNFSPPPQAPQNPEQTPSSGEVKNV